MSLTAGKHYPGSYAEMLAWFPTDAACLDYLDWLRWSDGFVCPSCSSGQSWRLPDGRRSCGGCRRRVSATAGTIFHGTRTPLTIWFAAAWFITTQKDGASALGLKRVLGLGSYGTAWTMLHRYRTAMVRPSRERLRGNVEVDETFIGGPEPGKRGRGAGGKVMVAIAVEIEHPTGFGRCRMQVIPNALGVTLGSFIRDNVELGSVVMTDGLVSYPKALGTDYTHKVFNIAASGNQAHVDLPGVHRVASLTKRWILSTYQGSVQPVHLQAYLDEFCFRFNRRNSRKRGMLFYRLLEQSVVSPPVTEQVLLKRSKPKSRPTTPPSIKRVHAVTLDIKVKSKPWRRATPVTG
jgi:transposase-like protein